MEVIKCLVIFAAFLACFVGAYTDEEVKTIMVRLHNHLRGRIRNCTEDGVPPAVWMPLLKWNEELAKKAKIWSRQCQVGHDNMANRKISKFEYVGQNWAGASTLERAFEMWLEEKQHYNHRTGKCTKVCGHYTQLVWAKTTEVGCAATECPKPAFLYGQSIVCNYGIAGNFIGQLPFQVGGTEYCGGSRT